LNLEASSGTQPAMTHEQHQFLLFLRATPDMLLLHHQRRNAAPAESISQAQHCQNMVVAYIVDLLADPLLWHIVHGCGSTLIYNLYNAQTTPHF